MLGMVNRAVEDYFRSVHGDAAWQAIARTAGRPDEPFLLQEVYPDALTVDLVVAGAAALRVTPTAMLDALGEHWVTYAGNSPYASLLAAVGDSIPHFLHNLNDLHARLALTFPALQPPRFWVTDEEGDELTVHYESTRDGLAPFVGGILRGLGSRFGRRVEVRVVAARDAGADHDRFRIRIGAPGA